VTTKELEALELPKQKEFVEKCTALLHKLVVAYLNDLMEEYPDHPGSRCNILYNTLANLLGSFINSVESIGATSFKKMAIPHLEHMLKNGTPNDQE
jgi:hypothetical protein